MICIACVYRKIVVYVEFLGKNILNVILLYMYNVRITRIGESVNQIHDCTDLVNI